ncbi:MAG: glycosyltransferase family 39 protein [Actinomycetota bacterium]|nr:glycosyltransferase family 39 protein [Actinomycetota bacterium]
MVLAGALALLVPKLWMAATTFGTNDMAHWLHFMNGVRLSGPIGVYGRRFPGELYNHPPLIGYYLELLNGAAHVGISQTFSLRAVSSVADVVTAVVVFELMRARRPLGEATVAGLVVACSPILLIISGYHGNTDPVFTMFALLSVYLLVDRQAPIGAGVAIALSIGVKIVPIVVVPTLLVYALRRGRSTTVKFAASSVVVSLLYWGPAMLEQARNIRRNVLGYTGFNAHTWGVDLLGGPAGRSSWSHWIEGPGRLLVVALCALAPALMVWLRPDQAVRGVALALVGFLALTPTFGTQYLVWAAAASALLSVRGAAAFNIPGGALLAKTYTRWNGGHIPWKVAHASRFTPNEQRAGVIVWVVLLITMAVGVKRMLSRHPSATASVATAGSEAIGSRTTGSETSSSPPPTTDSASTR